MSLYSTIFHYKGKDFETGKITLALTISIVVALILQKLKLARLILPLFAFAVGATLLILNLRAVNKIQDLIKPYMVLYWNGYQVGMFYMLFVHLFLKFEIKLGVIIACVVLRWSFVDSDAKITTLNLTFLDMANLLVMYYYERHRRYLFKAHFDFENQLKKFRVLLTDHLPHNIVILNRTLDKKLFANNSFVNHFKIEKMDEIKDLISSLKINLHTLDQSSSSINDSSFTNISEPSLMDYLHFTKIDKKSEGHITCFNVENIDEEDNKISYEVKVFHLDWDGQSAITIMLNDLTQQQTILALKIADENKDRLLATVSHELRTPINGMLGITQIIEQEYEDPKLLAYTRSAKVCAKMLLNLVNSILDLAQIRNLCIKLNPAPFRIQEVLDEVGSIFKPQCSGKNVDFKIKVSDEIPKRIRSDQGRLIQVIINLLANALKFTFKGSITLSVTQGACEDELKFTIVDTGTGIKDEDKPKLFKAFGKISQTNPKINPQGVGLGLTISNSLVNLLNPHKKGSKIEFESEYGKGSTFYFTIYTKLSTNTLGKIEEEGFKKPSTEKSPLVQIENFTFNSDSLAEFNSGEHCIDPNILKTLSGWHNLPSEFIKDRKPKEPEIATKDLASILISLPDDKYLLDGVGTREDEQIASGNLNTVLIVDDNSLNLMIASKLLQKQGFSIVTAYNGQDAILKVKEQQRSSFFSFILMDCQMPIMDGFEATKVIKGMIEKEEIPDVPIYALTANDSKRDQERCVQAGMVGSFSKPLKQEDLQKLVKMFLKS